MYAQLCSVVWHKGFHSPSRAPRGGVTRQGVVLTDLQSLRDCEQNFSLSLSLSLLLLLLLLLLPTGIPCDVNVSTVIHNDARQQGFARTAARSPSLLLLHLIHS